MLLSCARGAAVALVTRLAPGWSLTGAWRVGPWSFRTSAKRQLFAVPAQAYGVAQPGLAESGECRGFSVTTGNSVVWVDDFISHKMVRAHSACSWLEGGCPVCLEHLQQAEDVDAYRVELFALARVC